ncbi:hypothetical protein PUNSTDRAFT_128822 [Punctularia strigosozonata HHB-11173 SS5]|uniref:uncharacterized protein n=1 Tax=Punctularia strigosozonata (strain HHB-11173) TaxID=741275 RepID=UPI00044164F2|nr:uncharacterized protein PUNSTDRAFT_128822 [Punctularia strigosozonata HHB-11173 SS5]EIN13138.1 hypothetical protein PUNSTDRAFT_128822 [Punctularia strigosozonata HHB-11173 SS5]
MAHVAEYVAYVVLEELDPEDVIMADLDPHWRDYRPYRDLLSISLTCKAWIELGLNALWKEVADVDHLTKLIQYPRRWDELRQASVEDEFIPPKPEDVILDRFVAYSRRVRTLKCHPRIPVPGSVFEILDASKESLFPRLQHLHFTVTGFFWEHATVFITSHLTHLEINCRDARSQVHRILHVLTDTAPPGLVGLKVAGWTFDPLAAIILSKLPSLREISISLRDSAGGSSTVLDAVQHLWRMPFLDDLSVTLGDDINRIKLPHKPQFHKERLTVAKQRYVAHPQVLDTILPIAPHAHELHITANCDDESNATSAQLDRTLQVAFANSSAALQTLEVRDFVRTMSYPATMMLQMPRLAGLRTLVFGIYLEWTDDVVNHIARSCPDVTLIDFGHGHGPGLTCGALISLATHCKQLRTLTINLGSQPDLVDIPPDVEPHDSLVQLCCWYPPEYFGKFLRDLFPNHQPYPY